RCQSPTAFRALLHNASRPSDFPRNNARNALPMTDPRTPPPLVFGDLQGCRDPFRRLLREAAPTDDTPLWFAGDLINRGPESLRTLRDVIALGNRATVV